MWLKIPLDGAQKISQPRGGAKPAFYYATFHVAATSHGILSPSNNGFIRFANYSIAKTAALFAGISRSPSAILPRQTLPIAPRITTGAFTGAGS